MSWVVIPSNFFKSSKIGTLGTACLSDLYRGTGGTSRVNYKKGTVVVLGTASYPT